MKWSRVRLRDVAKQVDSSIKVDPLATYRIAGIYSFGRGMFVYPNKKIGSEWSAKRLQMFHEGDFIVSKVKAWEGAIAIVPKEADGCEKLIRRHLQSGYQSNKKIVAQLQSA